VHGQDLPGYFELYGMECGGPKLAAASVAVKVPEFAGELENPGHYYVVQTWNDNDTKSVFDQFVWAALEKDVEVTFGTTGTTQIGADIGFGGTSAKAQPSDNGRLVYWY
jgi:hypothetical protein